MRSGSSFVLTLSIYASLSRIARTAARPLPDQSLNTRQGETTPVQVQTWPGKPYVSFISKEGRVLDIANCGDTSLSQTQLHWTQDGVVSPDARAKCQTALLLPVPGTDPHDGIFAIVIADSILRGYRAWQAGLAGQTTLFVGSGFDPVWQLSQQFKITCKVAGDEKYRGKSCYITSMLDGRCLFQRGSTNGETGQGPVEWDPCLDRGSGQDPWRYWDLRRLEQDFSQDDHAFPYLL